MVGSVLILTWTDTRFPNYKVVFVNDVRSSTLASNHHQVVEFHTSGPLVAFYTAGVHIELAAVRLNSVASRNKG